MDKLEEAREKINEIDKTMAELFCKRMEAVKQVAESKQEMGLPVLNLKREDEVINRNTKFVKSPELRSYYVNFLKYTMDLSKSYQHRLLKGIRVAYSGVPGAFANIAAKRIFPDGTPVAYDGFRAAYNAVESGECDCAVLPIENSFAGDVTQVMDLSFFGSLFINGVYDLEIMQNLIGVPGASVRDVSEVISHPQALGQCDEYIRTHGFMKTEASNTAAAALTVAKRGDKSIAAIASEETAKLYNLQVLERAINQSANNTTRFAVFSRIKNESPKDRRFIMFFTVNNTAGSLGAAISVLGKHNLNLRALKSRPTKSLSWEYYFFAEGDGNLTGDNGKEIINELKKQCSSLKVIGSYQKEISLK